MSEELDEDVASLLGELEEEKPKKKAEPVSSGPNEDDFDDPADFLSELKVERAVPDISKPWMKYHKFTLVESIEQLREIIDAAIESGACSLDLETQGLDNRIIYNEDGSVETVHKIVGYCLCYNKEEGFYVPVRHNTIDGPNRNLNPRDVDVEITRLCRAAIPEGTEEAKAADPLSWKPSSPPKVVIYFWNAQFDQEFLFPVTGIDWWHPDSFEDGMLAAFTVFAADKRLSLKAKSKEFLRDPDGNPYEMIELKELFGGKRKNIRFEILPPDEPSVLRYTGSDAICTFMLCTIKDLVQACLEKHAGTYRLEKQTTCTLRAMERNRVYIEREWVRTELEKQQNKREDLLQKIQNFAFEQRSVKDLDPNSPKQLSSFLFGPASENGLDLTPKPEKNEASQQYKTDEATLTQLASSSDAPPILKHIVEFRGVEKYIGTYLNGLANNPDDNSELRFAFKQTGAGTGRFSAPGGMPDHGYSGIPIHGIPGGSEIRRVFKARPGYTLAKCDYAGEELRIAANITKEPIWVKEFLEGSGDLHSITARAFFGKQEVTKAERSAGKIANFSLLYGGGPAAIIRATGCDKMEARRRKQAFDKSVPVFASWIKKQHSAVKKNLGVRTAFGRWLAIPDANHVDQKIRAACERHAVNYQIQGAGADIMKIALVLLHKEFFKRGWLKNGGDDSVRMLLTVHDEVVVEIRHDRVPEVIPIIVERMEHPWKMAKWTIPLVVEPLLGFNWASGFDAVKVGEDYKPKDTEVVINGFAYSTLRTPKKNKQGEIVETLDQNEEEFDGKFRVLNPPWLEGYPLGTNSGGGSSGGGSGETPVAERVMDKIGASTSERELLSKGASKMPEEQLEKLEADVDEALAQAPKAVEAADRIIQNRRLPNSSGEKVLKLTIERLTEQTADQMVSFIMQSGDAEGPVLHVATPLGETLISPDLNLRVDKEQLMSRLRKYNLLCADL